MAHNTLKILYLEDDADDIDLLKVFIEQEFTDVQLEAVRNADEFKNSLKEQYSIILVDYVLPDIDGRHVLHLLRELNISTPVIILSGALNEETAVDLVKDGAWDFVLKDNLARLKPSIKNALKVYKEEQKNIEKEGQLLRLKNFYETVLETVNDGIWVADKDDTIYYSNNGMEQISGISKEKIIGKSIYTDFPQETTKTLLPFYENAKESQKPVHFERELVTPSNKTVWQTGWLMPLFQNNEFTGMICTVRDITEKKDHEQLLVRQKNLALKLNANIPIGQAYELILDELLAVSQMDCGVIYQYDQVTGELLLEKSKNFSENFISNCNILSVNSCQRFVKEQVYYTSSSELVLDIPFFQEDGILALTFVPVKHDGELRSFIILGSHKLLFVPQFVRRDVEAISALLGNVLTRLKVTQALETSQQQLDIIFQNSPVPMWEVSASKIVYYLRNLVSKGVSDYAAYFETHKDELEYLATLIEVKKFNKASVLFLEYNEKEHKEMAVFPLFTKNTLAIFLKVIISLDERQDFNAHEVEVLTLNGSPRNCILRMSLPPGFEHDKESLILTFTDITERKAHEKDLAYRTRFEKLVSSLSTRFISSDIQQIDQAISDSLKMIGSFTEANRAYLSILDEQKNTMSNTHEWCSEGTPPLIHLNQNIPLDYIPFFSEKIKNLENIIIDENHPIPDQAVAEKEIAQAQNLCSVIMVPISFEQKLLGTIGLDFMYPNIISDDIMMLLKIVADMLANIMLRRNNEKALRDSEQKYRNIFNSSPLGIFQSTPEGELLEANKALADIFGYESEERLVSNYKNWSKTVFENNNDFQKMISTVMHQKGIHVFEHKLQKDDGSEFWANLYLTTFKQGLSNNQYFVEGIIEDIDERKINEERINASLKEKEVLLQEIHHRVKNNLQIISSLLNLQLRKSDDNQAIELLKESQNRIRSMALIHEKLYRSHNLSEVNFRGYVKSLTTQIMRSYTEAARRIQFKINVEDLILDIDSMTICGLIINELVTNSIKHAFSEDQRGSIDIKFNKNNGYYNLCVSDDGDGFAENFDVGEQKSLGLHLVSILVEDQLGGELNITNENGTQFEILFQRRE